MKGVRRRFTACPSPAVSDRVRPMSLTGKQRRHLRALAHGIDPSVQVGKEGLSESVVTAVESALANRELVKVRIGRNSPRERDEAAAELVARTKSELAQTLGKTFLLFRANPDPEKSKIRLPAAATREA